MLYRVIPAGDLAIGPDGDLVMLTGLEEARQNLSTRFKMFLSEWFLDQREGVPYFRDVFVKNPDLRVIRSVFRQVALSVPGIVALPQFDVVFTPATRSLAFNFQARLDTGEQLVAELGDSAFIITVLGG